jgi:hypothetical protein
MEVCRSRPVMLKNEDAGKILSRPAVLISLGALAAHSCLPQ